MKIKYEEELYKRSYKDDLFSDGAFSLIKDTLGTMFYGTLTFEYSLILVYYDGDNSGSMVLRSKDFKNDIPMARLELSEGITKEQFELIASGMKETDLGAMHSKIVKIIELLFLKSFI